MTKVIAGADAKKICRLGQEEECCAFLVCGPRGFECVKKSFPYNSIIFKKLAKGQSIAKGTGDWDSCFWTEGE